MMTKKIYQEDQQVQDETLQQENKSLMLYNDEVHTFDYVIDSLIEICEHDLEQAEQCTFIVHYKGKCDVKKGDLQYLKPMRRGLSDRGLRAKIV